MQKFADISGYPDREKQYHEQIACFEKKYKELEEIHCEEIKKLEKMFSQKRDKKDNKYKFQKTTIEEKARISAEKEAMDSEKLVEDQNEKLNKQLSLQKLEVEFIKIDRFSITKDNLGMKQKMQTNHGVMKDFKTINHKQTMKIKKLNEKIDYLKKYISSEVVKFTKELEILKNNNAKNIYESEYQIKCNLKKKKFFLLKYIKSSKRTNQNEKQRNKNPEMLSANDS